MNNIYTKTFQSGTGEELSVAINAFFKEKDTSHDLVDTIYKIAVDPTTGILAHYALVIYKQM